MPKRKQPEVNENIPEFVLLEKDLFLIEEPWKKDCRIQIPSVQTCIALILWHENLCAVIHANGHGNEVAAYNFIINEFIQRKISSEEVKVFMMGGFYNQQYTSFLKETLFWAVGSNSNAIAHPMLCVLKKNNFKILQENQIQHKSFDKGNFCITFYANDISNLEIKLSKNEEAYVANIKEEFSRRGELEDDATARMTNSNSRYQVFKITGDMTLTMEQQTNTPSNDWTDTYTSWFPRP